MDLSLFKIFPIHESTTFEIRGEFFNILNTPNFGSPGTGLGSSSWGVVTLTQANDARIGQLPPGSTLTNRTHGQVLCL